MKLEREEFDRIFAIFKEESLEHIQKLNEGFLSLEKGENHSPLLSELFRHAHSIKGSARMMGLSSIEKVAHAIETALGKIQKGEIETDTRVMGALYTGVDTLSDIIANVQEGNNEEESKCEEMIRTLALLTTPTNKKDVPVCTSPLSRSHPEEKSSPSTPPAASESTSSLTQEHQWERRKSDLFSETQDQPPGRRKADSILHETIRVATKKLDNLMNQIGELLTTKIKFDQRIQEVKSLMDSSAEFLNKLQQLQKRALPEGTPPAFSDSYHSLLQRVKEELLQLDKKLHLFYHNLSEDRNQLSLITDELQKDIKKTRMLPFFTAVEVLPRMVRDLAQEEGKSVRLTIEGGEVELDKNILEKIKEPLIHLIRNAIDHGIETPEERIKRGKPAEGTITIRAIQQGDSVLVDVSDDGNGIQLDVIKQVALKRNLFTAQQLDQMSEQQLYEIIFQPGFSTCRILTDVSGRGVGLDVVRTNIEKLKGIITIESTSGKGTTFSLKLPLTMVTLPILKTQVQGKIYSLPISSIEATVHVLPEQIFTIEGQEAIIHHHRPIPLVHMEDILELPPHDKRDEERKQPAIILGFAEKRVAFLVDKLVGEDVVVAKPLGSHLERVRNISGATILGSGEISLILNVADLIESAQFLKLKKRKNNDAPTREEAKKSILVIEDSVTTRALEVSILESAGYEVVAATDGQDGFSKLMNKQFDLIVTDVQMPVMDGFTFTQKVKSDQHYQHIPVILLTSLESPAEKKRGIEVGANAYIVKSSFDQNNLLDTIKRLL